MASFQPRRIIGKWSQGYALDLHTVSSVFLGHDQYGHAYYDNTYSEVGQLLFQLKYRSNQSGVEELAEAVERFMKEWNPGVDILVPVPPSNPRPVQPVFVLTEAISKRLGIPVANCVKRARETPQLKNVYDLDERLRLLDGLHEVDTAATQDRKILLFDDLYRSGATMNAVTAALYDEQGKAAEVFALTITRTRSNQ
jgi:predicted amidophosphoribosyltransferase